jgi:hypothetical protein
LARTDLHLRRGEQSIRSSSGEYDKLANMIHVATVHWQDNRWIDVQLEYLKRHINEPFRVYAWLNEVPGDHRQKFHYVSTEAIRQHAIKLNVLADLIYFDSNRGEDIIIFLDGDAFPIGDIIGRARQKLAEHPLVAVQRLENNGDPQPHPCFCVTTVEFWKRIGGDWKEGYMWNDPQGRLTTDVGGNLLGILKRQGIDWYPMLRSNRTNLHPLWFGIYDGLIYHHGAGFRAPISRIDEQNAATKATKTWRSPLANMIGRIDPDRQRRWLQRALEKDAVRQNRELSAQIFNSLRNDTEFYRKFS